MKGFLSRLPLFTPTPTIDISASCFLPFVLGEGWCRQNVRLLKNMEFQLRHNANIGVGVHQNFKERGLHSCKENFPLSVF